MRLMLISWILVILIDVVLVDAQRDATDRTLRDRVAARRHRRHRTDKAKLIRNFLKRNGRLEGMVRLVDGPHPHVGNEPVRT